MLTVIDDFGNIEKLFNQGTGEIRRNFEGSVYVEGQAKLIDKNGEEVFIVKEEGKKYYFFRGQRWVKLE